jgi:thiamine pyrophosphate-dependent acetolactate synthase large subunit-like protein
MKVYQRMARAFRAEGITHTFGIMGDGNMYWLNEMIKLGATDVEVRHEGAGLGMADGWARATRKPACATATCGPGVSQLATALITASRASSPVVAFCGEHPTNDDEYNQRMEQAPFAAACETQFVRLASADTADEVVRRAFYLAKLNSKPVMLSAPMDIQQQEFEDDDPYVTSDTLMPSRQMRPDPDVLERAADLLCKAKRPIVLVGRGAMWSGAGDAIKKLAERSGALIITTLMAKTWLSEDEFHLGVSGTYATKTAMELCEASDCVVAVGASLNRYTTEHGYLYDNAKFIHIDAKQHVMLHGTRAADIYMQADARIGTEALEDVLAKRNFKQTGYRTGEVREQLGNAWEDRHEYKIEPGTADPREVVLALDELVPENINLYTGSGHTAGFSNILFRRRREVVMPGHFYGCIGQMMPAAIGAVMSSGNKPAMLVDGEASTMMHLNEFDTMVRHKVPLLMVVQNNEMLGAEYYKLDAHKMNAATSMIPSPDLGAVARGYGGRGVMAKSVEDVRKAAAEWVAKPGPMLIDVRISHDVVSLPYRRIHYGLDE